jgi:transcription antitermination factor NusG
VSNKEYFEVLNNTGAVCYVAFGGKAASIPDNQIQTLKTFVSNFNDKINVTRENISKGTQVRIKRGLLKDVQGEIVEIRGKNRIVLRFESLGYCIHSEIAIEDVECLQPFGALG